MQVLTATSGGQNGRLAEKNIKTFVIDRTLVKNNKITPWFPVKRNTKSTAHLSESGLSLLAALGQIEGVKLVRFAVAVGNKKMRECSMQIIYADDADPDEVTGRMELAISPL